MNAIKPEVVWIVIGLVLLIAEFAVPGLVVFFFGLGAIGVGILCMLMEMSINSQILAFILGSLAMLISLRHSAARVFSGATSDAQNASVEIDEIVGQRARVVAAIDSNEDGRIEFHGTQWPAISNDHVSTGSCVEIVGRDNLTFVVRPI